MYMLYIICIYYMQQNSADPKQLKEPMLDQFNYN